MSYSFFNKFLWYYFSCSTIMIFKSFILKIVNLFMGAWMASEWKYMLKFKQVLSEPSLKNYVYCFQKSFFFVVVFQNCFHVLFFFCCCKVHSQIAVFAKNYYYFNYYFKVQELRIPTMSYFWFTNNLKQSYSPKYKLEMNFWRTWSD